MQLIFQKDWNSAFKEEREKSLCACVLVCVLVIYACEEFIC